MLAKKQVLISQKHSGKTTLKFRKLPWSSSQTPGGSVFANRGVHSVGPR